MNIAFGGYLCAFSLSVMAFFLVLVYQDDSMAGAILAFLVAPALFGASVWWLVNAILDVARAQ